MHSTSRIVLVGILATMLASCGLWQKRKAPVDGLDYSTPGAGQSAPVSAAKQLEVPPDLITPSTDDHYVVPDSKSGTTYSSYAASRKEEAQPQATPAAAPSQIEPSQLDGKIRIERAGTERWLVVKDVSKAQLWPKLQGFWHDMGFVLVTENEAAGLMETDWAENHANIKGNVFQDLMHSALGTYYSGSERDKFRMRLEDTAEPGAVEIYISHRHMEEVNNGGDSDGTHWESRAPDSNLDDAMLQRVMVTLGTQPQTARKMVQDAKTPMPAHARIVSNGGNDVLFVDDSLERAWRRVGLALDRTGVVVEDRDRSKGIYFVRYIKEDDAATKKERSSWLARLLGSDDDESKTALFSVQVKATNDGKASITVFNRDGSKAPAASVKSILTLLLNELK